MGGAKQSVMACFVVGYYAFLPYLFTILTADVRAADRWPTRNILPSVVRIAVQFGESDGTCTAFSVSDTGRFVTAAHCAQGTVAIGDTQLYLIERDDVLDLALLQTNAGGLPALKLGAVPKPGDDTLAVGYPANSPKPLLIPTMYQGQFDAWVDGGNFAIFAGNAIPGMSGGPIVNRSGEVISVILGGGNPAHPFQNVGFGVPYPALRKMLLKWKES